MGDIFKEQLIKREKNAKDDFKKFIIAAVAVALSIFVILILGIFAGSVVVLVIALIAAYFIFNLNIEYEYAVTNDELDIDRIYNKSRRKRVFSGNCADFEIMTHIDDKERLAKYEGLKTLDFSSGGIYGNTYVFVASLNGKNTKIIIEPNDEILNAMYITMTPKKLFKRENKK